MSLVQPSDFKFGINIPHRDEDDVQKKIQWFIDKYEPLFLTQLLGPSLYAALKAGLNENDTLAKWSSLRDIVTPLAANYVYWWYLRKNVTTTVTTGEASAKNSNSNIESPIRKMVDVWNENIYCCRELVANWNVVDYGMYYLPNVWNYYNHNMYYSLGTNLPEIFTIQNTLNI